MRESSGALGLTLIYSRGSGLVLSAGSITFGGSLVKDPVLDQVMKNALTRTLPVPEPPHAIGILAGAALLNFLNARRNRKTRGV